MRPVYFLYLLPFILFLHLFISTVVGSSVFLNINTWITFAIWATFIYLAYRYKKSIYLLGPIAIFIVNELLYIHFNIDGLDGPARTKLYYDITTTYFIKNSCGNTNLTEGIYLKDLNNSRSLMTLEEAKQLDPEQANVNKYRKFFIYANITQSEYKGLRVLDMGCGNGDFMKYCNSLGMKTSGMAISNQQVEALKKQGLDVYLGDYRELQPQFIGKYDIITYWGSLEHITQSYPCSKSGEKKADKVIKQMFSHLKKYFRPDSTYKLVFTTTIHMNKQLCKNTSHAYILERAYGGWYFYESANETVADKAQQVGFRKLKNEDFTYHYFLATKIDPSHFGNPGEPNLYNISAILFGLLINPSLFFMSLYTLRGEWMWQFDNQFHFDENCNSCTFVTDRSKRPTTLLWSLNKLDE
jgi:cyclopropane fatty-acyl-phospholipid synthase-like methyltransferase